MPESKKDAAASLPGRLAPDPKNPPDLTLLQGWLGASSEAKHRRLYLDPELSNSLEIPEDAIVHTQEIPRDANPLGGEWVWIKADAAVKQGPGLERVYSRFLRGQIQQDYFAGGGGAAAAGGGMVGAPGPGAGAYQPIRTIFNCPTQAVWCRQSQLTICASSYVICRPTIGFACVPSAAFICQTRICPSAVDACPSAPGGCDPWTIYQQTGTIVQQPGGFGDVAGGGLGFDPGIAAGGMVGGPNPAAMLYPRTIIGCPSQLSWCRPSVLTICITRQVFCQQQVSAAVLCQTRICPSAVDACPSAPGGCDPWTIYQQTGTIVQQPVDVGGFGGGGLGFDPGIAAGGMVGGPNPAALAYPVPTIINCPSRLVWCRPSVLTICITRQWWCAQQASAAVICQTRVCPSAVDACPSAPGGCDPWTIYQQTGTIVQQPGGFGGVAGGVAGGGPGFDPGVAAGGFGGAAGGMVGAPAALTAQYVTSPAVCQLATRTFICRPTLVLQQCHTLTPICWITHQPQCVTMFTCPTQYCPTNLTGCPSGPICGGGGGYPGGGGGF
jgi:hypothetical protein